MLPASIPTIPTVQFRGRTLDITENETLQNHNKPSEETSLENTIIVIE